MSKLTDEEVQILQPIISGVTIGLKRKYPMLDREDIEQECWVWAVSRSRKVREYLQEDGPKQGRLARAIRNAVVRWCEKEKAAIEGYKVDDLYFYSKRELLTLVGVMLSYEDWLKPPGDPSEAPRRHGDPAIGNNWVAILSDVSRAFSELEERDREVLYLRTARNMTLHQLGDYYNVSHVTADRWVERALKRLHDKLGGEPINFDEDDSDQEYVGIGRRTSNAADIVEIERNYDAA